MGKLFMIGVLGFVAFVGYSVVFGEKQPPKPGEDKFDTANSLIFNKTDGHFHGNTPSAKERAKRFSELVGVMQKIAFTGGKKNRKLTLTGEDFLTYCNHSKEGVCFLVHVPQLKNYKGSVRDSLIKLCWNAAKATTQDLPKDKALKLGVGLRGSVFYGGLAIGTSTSDKDPKTENAYSVGEEKLFPFFAAKDASDQSEIVTEKIEDKKEKVAAPAG